ncbi:saccharopine dehydrogenase NADP-binding domain-containing protein [Nocardia sp. BSTN01]|uniref:saccharopine dehydrogenase NADP-binding domain-containing protein n=1 Tax=Nocardia sp. BSTN01 TaxID=2783665 RepID=UPI00188F9FDD|nr:saccharopine dehydrogenase NADP-binding domain-containing protein [Nocardia sp. BSTN01]MBF4998069.1 saccharopine dehydrogenase NADP-binding domain-containing protein [Nocardia sp. BSTN01]
MKTRILLLGAGGATGRTCLGILAADPNVALTVAGRNPRRLRELCASLPVVCCCETIDFDALAHDGVTLVELALHADVVVNCAGPSHHHSKSVAAIVMMCGAVYIDPGLDRDTIDRLNRCRPADGVAVVQTGVQPGISELAVRLLAQRLGGRADSIVAWCGGLQPLTRAAAADYLAGLTMAHAGPVVRRAGVPVRMRPTDASPPPPGVFPPSARGRIHLDAETAAAGEHIGAADIEWMNMIDGDRTERLIQSYYGATGQAPTTAAEIDRLCAAATADLFGREQYFALLVRARRDGRTSSFLLRARDSYAVTGATTAWAATHAHSLPAGIHRLATLDSSIALVEDPQLSATARVHIADSTTEQAERHDSYEQGLL